MHKITPEKINEWRIIPRIMVFMYGILFWRVCEWFMNLTEPSSPQATFVSVIVGAAAAFFGFYVNSGNKKTDN